MKIHRIAILLASLLALTACAPKEASKESPKNKPETLGYSDFSEAYQKSTALSDLHYDLTVSYDVTLKDDGFEPVSAIVDMSGDILITGTDGNNASFLSNSTLKFPFYDDAFDLTSYYADGILHSDHYSAADKTRTKFSEELMYGAVLANLTCFYEFMNFPESAILSAETPTANTFSCTLASEKVSAYLYSFTATPLYDTIGTALTKWEFSDISLQNTINAEGYLTAQTWTVTATGLISNSQGNFTDTTVIIQAEMKLIEPGNPVKITPPDLADYVPRP